MIPTGFCRWGGGEPGQEAAAISRWQRRQRRRASVGRRGHCLLESGRRREGAEPHRRVGGMWLCTYAPTPRPRCTWTRMCTHVQTRPARFHEHTKQKHTCTLSTPLWDEEGFLSLERASLNPPLPHIQRRQSHAIICTIWVVHARAPTTIVRCFGAHLIHFKAHIVRLSAPLCMCVSHLQTFSPPPPPKPPGFFSCLQRCVCTALRTGVHCERRRNPCGCAQGVQGG